MQKKNIFYNFQDKFKQLQSQIEPDVLDFIDMFEPFESENLYIYMDLRTNAIFCECHVMANKLLKNSTVDVPLDPEEQSEYRANRELDKDNPLYIRMVEDAMENRSFSNLVAEYNKTFDIDHPLKIIGGQHRYSAINLAFEKKVNQYHGIKVYFNLDSDQRMDVQIISNTNIDISPDLLDRVLETNSGPNLRLWCQKVGLLEEGKDFADKRQQGPPITVRTARTFIQNFYLGLKITSDKFGDVETLPIISTTGGFDKDWDNLKNSQPDLWNNKELNQAGNEFTELIVAQRDFFLRKGKMDRKDSSFSYVTYNYSIVSSWAFIAGVLQSNKKRLSRHYSLKTRKGKDPLNATALSEGRHKSDPENYRGIATRTGPKERGRLCELFFAQAEKGEGITPNLVTYAIKSYHAKMANLEAMEAKEKI